MQITAVKSIREEKAAANDNIFHMHAPYANQPMSNYNESVVVIVPSGNYNEPRELGRYADFGIALNIVKTLDLTEYRIFSLHSGNEIHAQ